MSSTTKRAPKERLMRSLPHSSSSEWLRCCRHRGFFSLTNATNIVGLAADRYVATGAPTAAPGGATPLCYPNDVNDEMVRQWVAGMIATCAVPTTGYAADNSQRGA